MRCSEGVAPPCCLRRTCCALTGLTTDDTNLGGGSADKCGGGNPAGLSGFLTDFMQHGFVRVCAKVSPTRNGELAFAQGSKMSD